MTKPTNTKKECQQDPGDCIEGHSIHIQCQKPQKNWTMFRKSGQHRGWQCKARKDAKATLLKKYVNKAPIPPIISKLQIDIR